MGPRVIITGGEEPAGLAAIRGLRLGGYRPVAAVTRARSLAGRSRAVDLLVRVADPIEDPARFVSGIARAAHDSGARAVLPGTEAGLAALARHRDALPEGTSVGAPPLATVLRATDKMLLGQLGERAGLAVARTVEAGPGDAPPLGLPCMVKPVRSDFELPGGGARHLAAAPVADREAWEAALAAAGGARVIVQEWVEGELVTVDGLAWEGRVVGALQKRALRVWPPAGGPVSAAEVVTPEPALMAATSRLLGELGWSGPFNLQLLRNAAGDHPIDLNPRVYLALALATAAGLNLTAQWADLLLGREPREGRAVPGWRFRAEPQELGWAVLAMRRGDLRLAARVLRPRRRTAHAYFHRADPGPALAVPGVLFAKARRALGGGAP